MSKHANPTLIGSFVVGAIALAIVSVLFFSKDKIFVDKDRYVVYFEGSVNGLKIGAPVKLKGVQIGIVSDIQARFDPVSKQVLTPVFMEIEPDMVAPVKGESKKPYDLNTLIDYGLRAQLTLFNIVTGHLYIEVDFLPDTPIKLVGADPNIPEIPVVPSSSEEFQDTVTKVVSDVRELPIKEIFYSLLKSIQKIEQLTTSQELTASAKSLEHTIINLEQLVTRIQGEIGPASLQYRLTMEELRALIKNINHQAESLGSEANQALTSAHKAADQIQSTMLTLERSSGPDSPLHSDIVNSLNEISKAAQSVKILADTIQQHPEVLIYGKQRFGID